MLGNTPNSCMPMWQSRVYGINHSLKFSIHTILWNGQTFKSDILSYDLFNTIKLMIQLWTAQLF